MYPFPDSIFVPDNAFLFANAHTFFVFNIFTHSNKLQFQNASYDIVSTRFNSIFFKNLQDSNVFELILVH